MLSILYFMLLRVIRREVRATKDGEPKSFQHSKPEKDYSLCPIPVLLPLRFIFHSPGVFTGTRGNPGRFIDFNSTCLCKETQDRTALGNNRRSLVRVGAFVTTRVHRRRHIVISGARLHRCIRIGQTWNQPRVDFRVARTANGCAIDVIAGYGRTAGCPA